MSDTASSGQILIGGEQLTDLLRILPYMTVRGPGDDGRIHVDVSAPEADAEPFFRALGRMQGALMVEDGDALFDEPLEPVRTDQARADDAFADLLGRILDARWSRAVA
jgi:hypothetical protein